LFFPPFLLRLLNDDNKKPFCHCACVFCICLWHRAVRLNFFLFSYWILIIMINRDFFQHPATIAQCTLTFFPCRYSNFTFYAQHFAAGMLNCWNFFKVIETFWILEGIKIASHYGSAAYPSDKKNNVAVTNPSCLLCGNQGRIQDFYLRKRFESWPIFGYRFKSWHFLIG